MALSMQNLYAIIGMTVNICEADGCASVRADGTRQIVSELLENSRLHLQGDLEGYPKPQGAVLLNMQAGYENLKANQEEAMRVIEQTITEREDIEKLYAADN